jgi:hypothetical protein
MKTIEELKAYAMAATGRAYQTTEEYRARIELVRLAEDHPELYNAKYFQAALDEQRRREAVLTKKTGRHKTLPLLRSGKRRRFRPDETSEMDPPSRKGNRRMPSKMQVLYKGTRICVRY